MHFPPNFHDFRLDFAPLSITAFRSNPLLFISFNGCIRLKMIGHLTKSLRIKTKRGRHIMIILSKRKIDYNKWAISLPLFLFKLRQAKIISNRFCRLGRNSQNFLRQIRKIFVPFRCILEPKNTHWKRDIQLFF